uniref:Uncharacterized protein n=1 Tax=Rhizophora mucronata TaxID=61149 RepID=A0A2P2KZF0_RHIMU
MLLQPCYIGVHQREFFKTASSARIEPLGIDIAWQRSII